MNYSEDFEDPMRKVQSTLETIDAGTAADRSDDTRWCRSWRNTLRRMGHDGLWAADKACRRVLNSRAGEDDKATARRCLHLIRDGYKLALRVDYVDAELANLYPADKAKWRLDNEVGWDDRTEDSDEMRLDRSCMKARASNPNAHVVKVNAFGYLRTQFPTLEMGG